MKILIIGHKGNLGHQLIKAFEGYQVIGLDKEELDITREKAVWQQLKSIKPNFVINASAYNAVDKCEEDPQEYELAKMINGEAPGYLAQVCSKIGAELVHYSSDYVFHGDKTEGYQEDDRPDPIQNYGRSKLMGEQAIKQNTEQYFIIRVSKLFGAQGQSEAAKKSFVDIMLELAEKEQEIEVVDEEMSCFTYTKDLAQATKHLLGFSDQRDFSNKHLNNPKSMYVYKKPHGIYHLVNEGPCTWYECAKKIFAIAGVNIRIKPIKAKDFPRPAKRPKNSVLLNTKLTRLRRVDEAIKDYLNTA
ncbi:MAG: dTDP-4-dehydrorhamnose reductase [Candidatus Moranbacteria bacterium]|nr:dTDP-4-dehydrorhamnose reductase [Candidatus Moranbacteria bacterium]